MQNLFSLTRYFLLAMILFLYSLSSSAGHIKFTGYIINQQGDTIKGSFSKYRQWNYNPDRVLFSSNQNSKQEILTPSTCLAFHIDGYETYIAFHGKRMTNPMLYDQHYFGENSDTFETITTFLREFAISDTYRFYIFKDKSRYNIYYSATGGVITELLRKVSIRDNYIVQSTTFKDQLQSLFPDKTKEINRMLYTEESLAAFIGKQKKSVLAIRKEQKDNGGLYISGGVSINSLKFNPNESMDFSKRYYGSRNVPLVSIGYVVPFSRNFSRGYFLPQLKISTLNHTGQTLYNDAYPVHSTTFRTSAVISLGFNFGYNIINHPNLKLSLAPGLGFNFLTHFKQVDEYKFSPINSMKVVTDMDKLKLQTDLQATVIIKKRYVIWSAYNFPIHVTLYTTTKDKFTSKQFGVGYKFR